MAFSFTEEQEELRRVVRRAVEEMSPPAEVRRLMGTSDGYDPEVWGRLGRDLGLTGVHIPEEYGGKGYSFIELDVPKHQGITYFIIALKQPGVVVRPLRQMNGYASFNEIFFHGPRAPLANVVGEVDRGWPVAVTTLAHERRGVTGMSSMMSAREGPAATRIPSFDRRL